VDPTGGRRLLPGDAVDDDAVEVFYTEPFSVETYAPSPGPTKAPTTAPVSAAPSAFPTTYAPTVAPLTPTATPTDCDAHFVDLDTTWSWTEEVKLELKMCEWYYSYSYGVVDILLYDEDDKYMYPVVQYEPLHDASFKTTYTVPKVDSEGNEMIGNYYLRVVEYGKGVDSQTQTIEILGGNTMKPTPRPTPSPSKAPVADKTINCFHVDVFEDGSNTALALGGKDELHGNLAPGASFDYDLSYYGSVWPYKTAGVDDEVTVTLRLCRGSCSSALQSWLPVEGVDDGTPGGSSTGTLDTDLEAGTDYRFMMEVAETGEICRSKFFSIS